RKSDQQEHNHKAQRPVWQIPCWKNRRPNLNDESRSDDVSRRDAIDFPPLQLVEEAAHSKVRRSGARTLPQHLDSPRLAERRTVAFALSIVSFFAGGKLSPGVREARSNRWVIAVFAVIGFLNAYLPAYTDRNELWTIDRDTIRWLGVALFATGGVLRIWPVFVLGQRLHSHVAI